MMWPLRVGVLKLCTVLWPLKYDLGFKELCFNKLYNVVATEV